MNGIPWTPDEEKYLRENWFKKFNKEIAKKLGRTPRAVANKAYRMALL